MGLKEILGKRARWATVNSNRRTTMKPIIGGFAVLMLLAGTGEATAALSFSDDFEGSSLNPFWSAHAQAGSITFPSTAQAHSGSQSIQFNSIQGAGQKNIGIEHDLAAPIFGTISVWLYDTGADVSSSNYLGMQVHSNGNRGASFQAADWEGGTYKYAIYDSGSWTSASSSIDRTRGWHQWEMDFMPDSLTLRIDGTIIYQDAIASTFHYMGFAMYGPSWRPAFVSYFDDFSLTEASVVPEPASIVTWTMLSLCGLAFTQRRRKQSA
jgi:hypothetical protein